MKKMCKALSLILSLCMVFTMLSGISAFAAESLAVVNWDADSEFIFVDFSHEVDLASLKAGLKLTLDGAAVEADVAYSRHASTDDLDKANITMMERYTYTITPKSGMVYDKVYKLTLANVAAKDESVTALSGYSKAFKVTRVSELKDGDSEMLFAESGNSTPWRTAKGGNYSTEANNAAKDEIVINATSNNSSGLVVLGRRGYVASETRYHYMTTGNGFYFKDYTIKATFNVVPATDDNDTADDTSDDEIDTPTIGLFALGTNITKQDLGTSENLAAYISFRFLSEGGKVTIGRSTEERNSGNNGEGLYTNISTGSDIELKLSAKNGKITGFVEDTKVADFQYTEDAANPSYGTAGINASLLKSGTQITISDVVITQAVEVQEITAGTLAVAAGGTSIEAIDGQSAITVTAPVTNNTGGAKDILAICALYDSNDKMVAAYKSAVTSVAANAENASVPFENIATKGATKLRVFIWDNLTSLIPYVGDLAFPAAE